MAADISAFLGTAKPIRVPHPRRSASFDRGSGETQRKGHHFPHHVILTGSGRSSQGIHERNEDVQLRFCVWKNANTNDLRRCLTCVVERPQDALIPSGRPAVLWPFAPLPSQLVGASLPELPGGDIFPESDRASDARLRMCLLRLVWP